ncbi:hypothetical protein MBLNU459_g1908t1 [Dothideomycetes sp. NU459]
MFPALQPSRPKYPPAGTAQQPSLRQTRSASQQAEPNDRPAHPSSNRPQSQIEAMPPYGPAQAPAQLPPPPFNSATRHPVFFTDGLRKPPFPLPLFPAGGFHPVATGYVFDPKSFHPSSSTKL